MQLSKSQLIASSLAVIMLSVGLFSVLDETSKNHEAIKIPTEVYTLFSKWKLKYGFSTKTPAELAYRLKVFYNSYREVRELRERYPDAKFELNVFSALSMEEFKKGYTGIGKNEAQASQSAPAGLGAATKPALPASKTVTLGPVKNQGLCQASWAFAAVAVIESKIGGGATFSEQNLMACSGTICSFNTASQALQTAKTYGFTTEFNSPWKGTYTTCQRNNQIPLKYWRQVYDSKPSGGAAFDWKTLILQPLVNENTAVAVAVYGGTAAFKSYAGGVYPNDSCGLGEADHYVTVVGFTDSGATVTARNSWGTAWGAQGLITYKPDGKSCLCGFSSMDGSLCSFAYLSNTA